MPLGRSSHMIGKILPIFAAALVLAGCAEQAEESDHRVYEGDDVAVEPLDQGEGAITDGDSSTPVVTLLGEEPAPGVWSLDEEVAQDIGPRAVYGEAGTDGRFQISCDGRAGQIVLSRSGTVSPGREVDMRIVTRRGEERFTARSSIGDLPQIEARIDPDADFLDTLAATSQPFAVIVESTEPLLLGAPGDTVRRVVAACRARN